MQEAAIYSYLGAAKKMQIIYTARSSYDTFSRKVF
jgi:hypothetical protein